MVDTIEASVHLLQCWIIHIVEFVIYILRNFDPCSCFLIFLWHRYDNFCFFRDFYAYLSILSFFFFRTGYIIILIEIPVYISTYFRIIYLSQFLESSCQYLWLFCHRLVRFWFFEYYGYSQVYIYMLGVMDIHIFKTVLFEIFTDIAFETLICYNSVLILAFSRDIWSIY